MNVDQFRKHGREMVDYICQYMQTLDQRRVTPDVDPGFLQTMLPPTAPKKGEKWANIMADMEAKIMLGVTHWNHPQFHAYHPSGTSYPSILADMLANAIGCLGLSWESSPACTELEAVVMDWLGKALGLPAHFISSVPGSNGGGVIQSSSSECTLSCMLAARAHAIRELQKKEPGKDESHFLPRLVAYCSQDADSYVEKNTKICLVKLRVLKSDDCSLRGDTLMEAMKADIANELTPFFVCAVLGTTATCGFDNLMEIGPVVKLFPNVWLHVDAAYAGSGFICPELRGHMDGIVLADSFSTDPDKWLLTCCDCSTMWVKRVAKLTSAFAIDPLYLQHTNSGQTIDYRHWGVPQSRRFRSLKLWFVLRNYGTNGLQAYVRSHCKLAKQFEALVLKDERFQLCNQVHMGLVCFRLRGSDQLNQQLLAAINGSGQMHMVPAAVRGRYIIRFGINAQHEKPEDIDYAWKLIQELAAPLLLNVEDIVSSISLNLDETSPAESLQSKANTRSVSSQHNNRLSGILQVPDEECKLASLRLTDLATPVFVSIMNGDK